MAALTARGETTPKIRLASINKIARDIFGGDLRTRRSTGWELRSQAQIF
jgi:hypothetical protein